MLSSGMRAALLALLLLGCQARRAPVEPVGPCLRVLTYNVNYGAPDAGAALRALAASGADLICLQESTPRWEAEIRAALSGPYPHMAFRHEGGAGGLAILSRRPFETRAWIEPAAEGSWFPAWAVLAETPLGKVQVLNVHLRPPLPPSAYFRTKAVRREEIRRAAGALDPALPALVCGDFNEKDGKAVGWLESEGFTDALPEFEGTETWRGRVYSVPLSDQLDHVLYSRHLRCASARVLKEGGSDHFPVAAVMVRPTGFEPVFPP